MIAYRTARSTNHPLFLAVFDDPKSRESFGLLKHQAYSQSNPRGTQRAALEGPHNISWGVGREEALAALYES